jgi:hypothetical protein
MISAITFRSHKSFYPKCRGTNIGHLREKKIIDVRTRSFACGKPDDGDGSIKRSVSLSDVAAKEITGNFKRTFATSADGKAGEVKKTDPPMHRITTTKDLDPFVGRLVAYIEVDRFFDIAKGYQIHTDKAIKFAYIDKHLSLTPPYKVDRYAMRSLIRSDHPEYICDLTYILEENERLKRDVPLFMRLATKEETKKVYTALRYGGAEFPFVLDKSEAYSLLKDHLSKLT